MSLERSCQAISPGLISQNNLFDINNFRLKCGNTSQVNQSIHFQQSIFYWEIISADFSITICLNLFLFNFAIYRWSYSLNVLQQHLTWTYCIKYIAMLLQRRKWTMKYLFLLETTFNRHNQTVDVLGKNVSIFFQEI